MSDNRVPPQDLDSERALLGALLSMGARDDLDWSLDDIRGILRAEAFYLADHQLVFNIITEAADAHEPMDFMGIVPRLQEKRQDDEWPSYTIELAESFSDLANAPFYARQVRQAWRKRELIRACSATVERLYNDRLADEREIIDALAKKLESLDDTAVDAEATPESDALRAMVNPRSRVDKIPVGLDRLGDLLDGGFDRGTLTIIGARPATGKTSLGLGLSIFAARSTEGCPVLFVSAEMSIEQISLRLLSMRTRVSLRRLRSGDVEDGEFARERNQAALLAEQGHGVYLTEKRNLRDIKAEIRRNVRRRGVGLVVVDYLQLLHTDGPHENQNLRVGAMCKAFKHLASDLNIAVVLLCQLSRGAESVTPTLAHLRDSGEIEQDADTVILLHKTETDPAAELAATDFIVAKQRQGQTGVASLVYRKDTFSYEVPHYLRGSDAPAPVLSSNNGDEEWTA